MLVPFCLSFFLKFIILGRFFLLLTLLCARKFSLSHSLVHEAHTATFRNWAQIKFKKSCALALKFIREFHIFKNILDPSLSLCIPRLVPSVPETGFGEREQGFKKSLTEGEKIIWIDIWRKKIFFVIFITSLFGNLMNDVESIGKLFWEYF